MENQGLPKLSLICEESLLFNARDYIELRRRRIAGNLIGLAPSHPNDLTMKGLPAVYNRYETRLMLEENLIQLLDKTDILTQKTTEDLKSAYKSYLDDQMRDQSAKWVNSSREMNKSDLSYHIPFQSTAVASGRLVAATEIEVDELKYRIFRDLWSKGYYVTMGNSFGGDFLIYKGDPIQVHASHVVHVLTTPLISSKDIVRCNRLCVGVKKGCLFAYLSSDEIVYQLTTWENWE